jgi:RNA polymerase sigma-70 factor (family 1)
MAEGAKELKDLFEAIAIGDKKAFDELFRGKYDLLCKFALSYVKQAEIAEEIVSELFVKLWLKRSGLDQISNPKVYLYVSVKNASLNALRKSGKTEMVNLDEQSAHELATPVQYSPETMLENKQLQAKLDQAIANLPAQRQLIFAMVKQDGLKCREVAEILNLSVRTVEGQVYKAIRTIADELTAYLGYNPTALPKNKLSNPIFSILF